MRVDPLGTPPQLKPANAGTAPKAARATDSSSSTPLSEGETFTPTNELASLLAAVKQTPEVRTEVIESATAKLASGELDTPEAAAGSARAMLNTPPEPPAQ